MLCSNCGFKNNDGVKFCQNCGEAVSVSGIIENQSMTNLEDISINTQVHVNDPSDRIQQLTDIPQATQESSMHEEELKVPIFVESPKKKKYVAKILAAITGAIAVIIICVILLSPNGDKSNEKYIDSVKTGYMGNYFDVTIGEVLESFAPNGKWDGGTTDSGKDIIEYKEKFENKYFAIQFDVIDENNFTVSAIDINGDSPSTTLGAAFLVEAMYQDYYKSKYSEQIAGNYLSKEPVITIITGVSADLADSYKKPIELTLCDGKTIEEIISLLGVEYKDGFLINDDVGIFYDDKTNRILSYTLSGGRNYSLCGAKIYQDYDSVQEILSDKFELVSETKNLKTEDLFMSNGSEDSLAIIFDHEFNTVSSIVFVADGLAGYHEEITAQQLKESADSKLIDSTDDEYVLNFTLYNRTGFDIYKIYLSPTNLDDWEEDILGFNVLFDEDNLDIYFDTIYNQQFWDLKIVDIYGGSIYWNALDLFSIDDLYIYFDNDGNTWALDHDIDVEEDIPSDDLYNDIYSQTVRAISSPPEDEILYNDKPILNWLGLRLADLRDQFGAPDFEGVVWEGGTYGYSYDGITFNKSQYGEDIDAIWGSPGTLIIDGVTLDMDREELINLFGSPVFEDWNDDYGEVTYYIKFCYHETYFISFELNDLYDKAFEFWIRFADETEDEYILPYSASRTLLYTDLNGFTSAELRLAKNEIYARHGRLFQSQDLQDYFNSKTWYNSLRKLPMGNEPTLSQIEKANVDIIIECESLVENDIFIYNGSEKANNTTAGDGWKKMIGMYDMVGSQKQFIEIIYDEGGNSISDSGIVLYIYDGYDTDRIKLEYPLDTVDYDDNMLMYYKYDERDYYLFISYSDDGEIWIDTNYLEELVGRYVPIRS